MTQTRENIAILFLLCLVLFSAYLLFWQNRFFEFNTGKPREVIATLTSYKNSVKYRAANELVWRDASRDAQLHLSDQIFTHENSSAIVKFKSGAELAIGPTALVKIEIQNNDAVLNLTRGMVYSVGTSGAGVLKIKTGQSQIMLSGKDSRFQIAAGEDGRSEKIAVFGSEAKVTIGDKTITVNKNQVVGRDAAGNVKVDSIEIEPVEPKANQSLNWSPDETIKFAWRSDKHKDFELIVASDADFKKIVTQRKVASLGSNIKLSNGGTYFWKVKAKSSAESLPQHFTLLQLPAPWPSLPAADRQFISENGAPVENIKFTWDSEADAEVYEFNLATDQGFKKVVSSEKNVTKKSLNMASLKQNSYFWRVRQKVGEIWSPWSEIQNFSVLQPKLIPDLLEPTKGSKFKFEPSPKPTRFAWTKPTFATQYKLYVYSDQSGRQIVAEHDISTEYAQDTFYRPGRYYWKVVAYDSLGEEIGESKLESFIRDNPPSLAPPKIDLEFKFKLKKRKEGEGQ